MWSSAVGPFTVTSNTVHSAWLDSKLHNVSLHNVPHLGYFSRGILIMQTGRLAYPSRNSWSPSWWRDVTGNDGLLECEHKKHQTFFLQPPGRPRSHWFQTDRQTRGQATTSRKSVTRLKHGQLPTIQHLELHDWEAWKCLHKHTVCTVTWFRYINNPLLSPFVDWPL